MIRVVSHNKIPISSVSESVKPDFPSLGHVSPCVLIFPQALAANANCLFGATHLGPLFFLLNGSGPADEELLVQQAVSTVFISHNNPDPIAASEFLARTLFRIIVNVSSGHQSSLSAIPLCHKRLSALWNTTTAGEGLACHTNIGASTAMFDMG